MALSQHSDGYISKVLPYVSLHIYIHIVFALRIVRTYFPSVASAASWETGADETSILDPPVRVAQAKQPLPAAERGRPVGRLLMGAALPLAAAVATASAVARYWWSVSRHTVDPIWILNRALVHL